MVEKVRKRDGSIVAFDAGKVEQAIWKAAVSVGGQDRAKAAQIAGAVVDEMGKRYGGKVPSVEDVQDIVEKVLIEEGHAATAKAYILYRHRKNLQREMKNILGVQDDLKLSMNSVQVLQRRYLLKDETGNIRETPSQLFRRVASYIASAEKRFDGDEETVKFYENAFYEIMTKFEFLPNSPTLMNAGTNIGQLSACFILGVGDSLDEIFDSIKYSALIHQSGGGTGFCFSHLRPKGDFVKSTAGVASGPISFMTVFDHATNVIKQGGKRRGANMGVLHIWHPDIEDFIGVKQTPGVLENFNISVGVDDEFMKAVEHEEDYALKNPRTGEAARRINASGLFKLIAYSAWKSAEPGVLFMDTINKANPTPKYAIVATNPCVAKETFVTTSEGLTEVSKVHNPHHVMGSDGDYHPVRWAGKTGEKEVYLVKTRAGYEVKATADHKFLTEDGWKQVNALGGNDRLVLQKEGKFGKEHIDREMAMMLGWLCGDGHISRGMQDVIFYFGTDEKEEMLPIFKGYLDAKNREPVKPRKDATETRLKYSSKIAKMFCDLGAGHAMAHKKEVPNSVFSMDRESVRHFLSALFGADGSVQGNRKKGVSIRLASNSLKLLKQVQVLLLQFGIVSSICAERRKAHSKTLPDSRRNPKTYSCRAQHELIISRASMFRFMDRIGFSVSAKNRKFEALKPENIYADNIDTSVAEVEFAGMEEVFDLTEPETHSFSANGLIVHNCGEVPMPDFESCNLGSINLSAFVELDWSKGDWKKKVNWERLRYVVRLAIQFLDNVVELNNYPLPQIRDMSLRHRRVGLGVMGFSKMLFKMGVRYDSPEGFEVGEEVMRFVTSEGRKMSHELGRARGSFPGFKESTWAKGYDAMRNATVTSIAPTGTISMIAETSSGIEPTFALAYIKNVMDGTKLFYSDDVFEQVLKVRGLYSAEIMKKIITKGSLKEIEEIPRDIRDIFVISHDIGTEGHIRMQAAFQKWTDLAVSKTINMPSTASVEDVENAYMLAWKLGCKGVTVYRDKSRGEQVLSVPAESEGHKES